MFEQFKISFDNLVSKLSDWLDGIILALPNLILAALFLVFSLYMARRLKQLVLKLLQRTRSNQTVSGLLSNLVVAGFMMVALFIILNILNLSEAVTALLGTAGVAGLAVGLALQDLAIIALKKAFDKNNITIPFPIRTLDFGVVGGLRLDEIYPREKTARSNGKVESLPK